MVDQIIVDDSMYVGREAHVNVELSSYTATDHTGVSFITTAVVVRVGNLHVCRRNRNVDIPVEVHIGQCRTKIQCKI